MYKKSVTKSMRPDRRSGRNQVFETLFPLPQQTLEPPLATAINLTRQRAS
jgi:hypothetical protein